MPWYPRQGHGFTQSGNGATTTLLYIPPNAHLFPVYYGAVCSKHSYFQMLPRACIHTGHNTLLPTVSRTGVQISKQAGEDAVWQFRRRMSNTVWSRRTACCTCSCAIAKGIDVRLKHRALLLDGMALLRSNERTMSEAARQAGTRSLIGWVLKLVE